MINLLSPAQKEEIKAARVNVQLRQYVLLSSFVAIAILAVYGIGFYLVIGEKEKAQQQLDQNAVAAIEYQTVQKEAKTYKSSLTIAKKVLSSGVSYSTFLTSVAQALPAGSVLTDLVLNDLGGSTVVATRSGGIVLHARTTSYGGALQVKDSLEASAVFESVSITDVKKVEAGAESTALEKRYPFTLDVSVGITKQGAIQ